MSTEIRENNFLFLFSKLILFHEHFRNRQWIFYVPMLYHAWPVVITLVGLKEIIFTFFLSSSLLLSLSLTLTLTSAYMTHESNAAKKKINPMSKKKNWWNYSFTYVSFHFTYFSSIFSATIEILSYFPSFSLPYT